MDQINHLMLYCFPLKVDLARLKQASLNQAGSKLIPYLSSNDVIMGLAWMLNNEAKNKARPGQGPAGTISVAIIGVDLGRNGLPGNLQHQSTLANLSKVSSLPFGAINYLHAADLSESSV